MGASVLIGSEFELRVRHLRRDAGPQARGCEEIVRHVLRGEIELKRQPEIGRRLGDEAASDHAYDQVGLAVHMDIGTNDIGIPAKAALP